ncbi:uncharacterized protein YgbK (DUF1537 family) [Pseudoroseomonas cervicalis]|nr:uncharacterized protein YgbK (DUF1537 family) [Pseudoroseomonas cervicalis]
MMPRWLILADDLTGAADCAVAFARRGHAASVAWPEGEGALPPAGVLAIDADTRRLDPAAAASRQAALLGAAAQPGALLFKKIDSTLRGQPIAELAGLLAGPAAGRLAVLAPAVPRQGRITRQGRIWLQGAPLEESALWAREHSYPHAELPELLRAAGLRPARLGLEALRLGAAADFLRESRNSGAQVVVCDAESQEDLAALARGGAGAGDGLLWVGAAGLAEALAGATAPGTAMPPVAAPRAGGVLLVVGSVAEPSRAAAALLAGQGAVRCLPLPAALLRQGEGPAWREGQAAILAALREGEDVLVSIEAAGEAVDLAGGAVLAERLAALLRPAGPHLAGLFATGGETARALLPRLGLAGLHLAEEVEPGMPLGHGIGDGSVAGDVMAGLPVVTKAGGFGDAGTISRALSRLRRAAGKDRP